jgi:PAS domain-containing protein
MPCTFELDVASGRVSWSDAARELLFLPEAEPADLGTLMARIHPREREAVRQAVMQAVFECRALIGDFHVVGPDGDVRHVALRAEVTADTAGRPKRMQGACLELARLVDPARAA